MNDKFPSVFIDSDKPELVCGIKQEKKYPCQPPQPKEYHREEPVVNRPYSDMPVPGPFVPDYQVQEIGEACPNPVPNTYLAPGHCHHKPDPGPGSGRWFSASRGSDPPGLR